jgi:hypothetical protein
LPEPAKFQPDFKRVKRDRASGQFGNKFFSAAYRVWKRKRLKDGFAVFSYQAGDMVVLAEEVCVNQANFRRRYRGKTCHHP